FLATAFAHAQTVSADTLHPHPRLFFSTAKLDELRARTRNGDAAVERWKRWVDVNAANAPVRDLALLYLLTGKSNYRDQARATLMKLVKSAPAIQGSQSSYSFMDNWEGYPPQYVESVSLGYDWLYDQLSEDE